MDTLLRMFQQQARASLGSEALVMALVQQLAVILLLTQAVMWFSSKFLGQTQVSGEILSGLLLGPSCFGALFPEQSKALFPDSTTGIMTALSQIGLIYLMFEVGLSFEFSKSLRSSRKTLIAVAAAGIAIPFAMGFFGSPWLWEQLPGARPPLLGFRIFLAISMSITAIPVLGRIFLELDMTHTRLATLVMGAAAINDVVGWILLGAAAALTKTDFSLASVGLSLGELLVYMAVVWFAARPLLKRALLLPLFRRGSLGPPAVALISIALFCSAAVTARIGVFAILGGFYLGVALHDDRAFVEHWKARTSTFVRAILLPIFFTYTGLRTDIAALHGLQNWIVCAGVLLVAFSGKIGGSFLAARIAGETPRQALAIGICMNTRGLMELIVLNVGYDLGVLPRTTFTMLVIMALASTLVTAPLFRWLTGSKTAPVFAPAQSATASASS